MRTKTLQTKRPLQKTTSATRRFGELIAVATKNPVKDVVVDKEDRKAETTGPEYG